MSDKTVFISYRRDATGKAFARAISQELTHRGYDVFLDVDCLDAGLWASQIVTEIPKRAHFLLLLTPGALDRCVDEADWVRRELLTAIKHQRNIVPVREESVDLGELMGNCPLAVKPVLDFQIATVTHRSFQGDIETLTTRYVPRHKAPRTATSARVTLAPSPADISRIDHYAPAALIGREAESQLLSHCWLQAIHGDGKRAHVLTFVAFAGEGKTSLVAKWVAELAHQNWPGCEAVLAWSFYSQGTREQMASSDIFLKEALTIFGDPEMAASALGAFEKGRRLANLVNERVALLILDGVEPLQYAPTSPTPGEFKDQGLSALLKGLAAGNRGLCVVTTRYSIPDLRTYWETTAPEIRLSSLSKQAGIALLRALGVRGPVRQLEQLVIDVHGHALTLNLLGSYLRDAHSGDIRRRDLVDLEQADGEEQGGHAFRVMDAYVKAFEKDGEKGKGAVAVLRLLGLFDRPASAECLSALLRQPAIPGLTDAISGMSDAQRNIIFARLEAAKLLTVNRDSASILVSLDAHPLGREYFAKRLTKEHPDAWRAAHRRLYKHLCATTEYKLQPSLDDLQPLYQAIDHGCQADMLEEACEKVYFGLIRRGIESYSTNKLGAFGSDLGAIACFFTEPWTSVSPQLSDTWQAWLRNEAGFCLRALGRLNEALQPMRDGLEMRVQQRSWRDAAICANNLSELELTLGDVAMAVRHAEHGVSYADRSEDRDLGTSTRATYADALHQGGRGAEAEANFKAAERRPSNTLLYGLAAFRHCELVLASSERAAWRRILGKSSAKSFPAALSDSCHAVSARARRTLPLVTALGWLLDVALDQLTAGRAGLYAAVGAGTSLETARSFIENSVDGLRRAGQREYLPRGLLSRAWVRSLEGQQYGPEGAERDLDEAWEIAAEGPMPLIMADIHLYRARLFGTREGRLRNKYPWSSPRADLDEARRLVDKHGYLRRKDELEDAETAAAELPGFAS